MTQDEQYHLLDQRLTILESQMSSLKTLAENLAALSQQVEQLANLEAGIAHLEENFSLISDVDTFAPLRDALAAGNFKRADQETAKILFGTIHKTSDTITPGDIETFPIAPLRIVDRLWRKYSNDHFGLSIQLKIYQELGGSLNTLIAQDEALFFAFCDRIGWRKNGKLIVRENWDADLSAPQGFLPLTWWVTPYGLKIGNFILARLIKGGL